MHEGTHFGILGRVFLLAFWFVLIPILVGNFADDERGRDWFVWTLMSALLPGSICCFLILLLLPDRNVTGNRSRRGSYWFN